MSICDELIITQTPDGLEIVIPQTTQTQCVIAYEEQTIFKSITTTVLQFVPEILLCILILYFGYHIFEKDAQHKNTKP